MILIMDIIRVVILSVILLIIVLTAVFTRTYWMKLVKKIAHNSKDSKDSKDSKNSKNSKGPDKNLVDSAAIKYAKELKNKIKNNNEVFHIGDNVFTYDQADAMCKSIGTELATYDQVVDAYKSGAEWCSYGWSKDMMALYPTQKSTYDALQNAPDEHKNDCGSPGINGGVFEDKEIRFGVNCYGKKPVEPINPPQAQDYLTIQKTNRKKLVKYFKDNKNNYSVLPFNRKKWSKEISIMLNRYEYICKTYDERYSTSRTVWFTRNSFQSIRR